MSLSLQIVFPLQIRFVTVVVVVVVAADVAVVVVSETS